MQCPKKLFHSYRFNNENKKLSNMKINIMTTLDSEQTETKPKLHTKARHIFFIIR